MAAVKMASALTFSQLAKVTGEEDLPNICSLLSCDPFWPKLAGSCGALVLSFLGRMREPYAG